MTQSAATAARPFERVASGNVTTANCNSGVVIQPNIDGRTIVVTGVKMRCNGGNAATATGIDILDNAGSPLTAVEIPVAVLTSGAWATEMSASTTTTNLGLLLTPGKGLTIKSNGTLATATSVDYIVTYTVQ